MGAVFLVNNGTVKEAMSSLILGMGQNHWHLVERIEIGAPIFVYNYSNSVSLPLLDLARRHVQKLKLAGEAAYLQMMYGCFKAITPGIYNLNPAAYGGKRPFPAQVKVAHDIEYEPVNLSEFQHIRGLVADGYKVSHELSRSQVRKPPARVTSTGLASPRRISSHIQQPLRIAMCQLLPTTKVHVDA